MAGMDPQALEQLVNELGLGRGKDGGGMGGIGGGLDPLADYNLSQADLNTRAHFARLGMSPGNTSEMLAMQGNRRAARAEAFNNRSKQIDQLIKLAQLGTELGIGPNAHGFEEGFKSVRETQQPNTTSYSTPVATPTKPTESKTS
jgi:hypothetical protein